MRTLRSSVVLSIFLRFLRDVKAATPPVRISLRSSWPAAPSLVEIIETVALENPDAFFPLLDTLTDPASHLMGQGLTHEAIYHSAIATAVAHEHIPDSGSLAAVEMGLALHSAAPKIEAFYQHYINLHGGKSDRGCGSWVDWYGETVCDAERLKQLAGVETIDSGNNVLPHLNYTRPETMPFDHIYPAPSHIVETPPRTAMLYASLASDNFRPLHDVLFSLAKQPTPHIEYILRHVPPTSRETSARTYLSGYGVALDLKKTDYLAVDDRHSSRSGPESENEGDGGEGNVDEDPVLSIIMTYPENPSAADATAPLTTDEIYNIGVQSTQLIADSARPVEILTQLSQNFPKYATTLARRVVANESIQEELRSNGMHAQPGGDMVWLNGAVVQEKDMDPFVLLRLLRKERTVVRSLTSLGLTTRQTFELLTHPQIGSSASATEVLGAMFDASDRLEGGQAIVWFNDFESDSRYERWSNNIQHILRPLFPGQYPNLRFNLYNIVLVMDLSKTSSLDYISGTVLNIISRSFPLRFGVVPVVDTADGARMAKLIYHLSKTYGADDTMRFLKSFSQAHMPSHLRTPTVDWAVVQEAYERFPFNTGRKAGMQGESAYGHDDMLHQSAEPEEEDPTEAKPPFEDTFGATDGSLESARAYCSRLGTAGPLSSMGHALVNGRYLEMNEEFLRSMQMEVNRQLQYLQEKVYASELGDDNTATLSTYFYDLPTTASRRNRYIYPSGKTGLRVVNLPDIFSRAGFEMHPSSYVYPSDSDSIHLSLYVIADLDSESGLTFVKEALHSIHESNSSMRITFVHNPQFVNGDLNRTRLSWLVSHLLSSKLLSKISPAELLNAFGFDTSVVPVEGPQVVLFKDGRLRELTGGATTEDISAESYATFIKASRLVARELQLLPGQQALIINGRVVGPIANNEFVSADFKTLEMYELRSRVDRVVRALADILPNLGGQDRDTVAHVTSMATSIMSAIELPDPSESGLFDAPPRPRTRSYQLLAGNHTAFRLGDDSTALYHFCFLLDPISEHAQKWSVLIRWLSLHPDVFIEVHLNPTKDVQPPLKRFYRYSVSTTLQFDEESQEKPAQVVFEDLPIEPIYTLAMDVPSSWLVRPRQALYDLDNIQLGSLAAEDRVKGVEAVFSLDHLVIEGHARDPATNAPPRGLQLELTKLDSTPVDDTQVVANLGYFQFKAEPGVFRLEIRAGRGRDIYRMESVGNEGWDSPPVELAGDKITLTSFEGLNLYPRLVRRPGMEAEDVLTEYAVQPEAQPQGYLKKVVSKVKSLLNREDKNALDVGKQQAEINIFTVASGLLYERFASIMILSVLRNTKSSVKFWFIENFLSPSFLEFMPHFADEYGFKYELVTYKWPSWLREQREKQRIIWAYKILFLDVLFPMDLKKVIFVDADQIVRTDLQELVDLDLHGAPYGYTPMGDDNYEMEGFRFWKTGYWKDFLRGLPYHISALYVVDLVRFRQIAAGDILRGQYQALSSDPHSLANLDQDLPNNLQREVPIFSLHEDWLWCETWCSKDRLDRAKTIDLCQNPLTKEPKLARARKIPEWEEYDSEISQFSRKLAEQGLIHSRFAAADTNALAGEGTSGGPAEPVVQEADRDIDDSNSDDTSSRRDEL